MFCYTEPVTNIIYKGELQMKILLLEDDPYLCRNIKHQLAKEDYTVDACGDGEEGFMLALDRKNGYDLAVIDRMLPVVDGLTIIKAMRSKDISIPVIVITGMSDLQHKIEGLDSGADDYLTKPFHTEELCARIRALTRRPAVLTQEDILTFHDISLDPAKKSLVCGDRSVTLTPTEFRLLEVFFRHPERVLSREYLVQKVWETTAAVEPGNLDNYIYFIRKRLRAAASECVLSSVYGSGYIFEKSSAGGRP